MNELVGIIGFDNYKINCIIGLECHERQCEQNIYVDLKIKVDISKAVISDDLKDTCNYVLMANICKEIAQKGRLHLLEKYAYLVLKEIIEIFPAEWAWIRIKKPQAITDADAAYVELYCTRSQFEVFCASSSGIELSKVTEYLGTGQQ